MAARPASAPMPRALMRLAWGDFVDGHGTVPRVALATGFRFRFPHIEDAMFDLLGPRAVPIEQRMNPTSW